MGDVGVIDENDEVTNKEIRSKGTETAETTPGWVRMNLVWKINGKLIGMEAMYFKYKRI